MQANTLTVNFTKWQLERVTTWRVFRSTSSSLAVNNKKKKVTRAPKATQNKRNVRVNDDGKSIMCHMAGEFRHRWDTRASRMAVLTG